MSSTSFECRRSERQPNPAVLFGRSLATDPVPAAQALILAGGEGSRLRSLTRELTGDDRPKQFATIVGGTSLLEQTRRRSALLIPERRTQIVLTRSHEPSYRTIVEEATRTTFLIQPSNRGTAAAVLYGLLRAARRETDGPVVILPSDHWISDDRAFMSHVAAALGVVDAHAEALVLLGLSRTRAEPQYGWIDAAEPVFGWWPELRRIRNFVEKPAPELAAALLARGLLWNTFVVVGRISRLLLLLAVAVPDLVDAFLPAWKAFGTAAEAETVDRVYARVPSVDLSRDVLAREPEMLTVLSVTGVLWEDLGDPARVRAARREAAFAEGERLRPPLEGRPAET
jgi:mannose-1-phosphate guanylyltransferase